MPRNTLEIPRELLVKNVSGNDIGMRLTQLAEQFASVNADDSDGGGSAEIESLLPCIKAIAAERIVTHRNKDVRLWAAVCLSQALRIFAPKGCIEDTELKPVILLFLEQLDELAKTGSGRASAESQALEAFVKRLTDLSAFLLLFRCSEPDELLKELVGATLNVAGARPDLEKTLVQLLVTVLSELEEVPGDAMHGLLVELTPGRKGGPAATCVRKVLKTLTGGILPVSLSEWLNQKFSSSILENLDPRAQKGTEDAVLCETVFEIVKVDPGLVARLLPVLRDELRHQEDRRRRRSTWLVGRMLAHEAAGQHIGNVLSNDGNALLEPFLARLEDLVEEIRFLALEDLGKALKGKSTKVPDLGKKCAALLADRILDPSERIRILVIQIVDDATKDERHQDIVMASLTGVVERTKDKRPHVREVALDTTGRIYEQCALPLWVSGQETDVQWIPRVIMEAYATQSKLGHVAHLEGVIERSFLGCGSGLSKEKRAAALLGLCTSIYGYEEAETGFRCMLHFKREAHAALRRFLELRMTKKKTTAGGQSLALQSQPQDGAYMNVLENFAKLSPSLAGPKGDVQDNNARFESIVEALRALDAVKDKGMWTILQELTAVPLEIETPDLEKKLGELDRILRVQNLAAVMMPLLRRALPATWLLPDQVLVLLKSWQELPGATDGPLPGQGGGANSNLWKVCRRMFGDLSGALSGAIFPHVREISEFLHGSQEDAKEALLTLSRLSKNLPVTGWMPPLDQAAFVKDLVCGAVVASEVAVEDATSSFCRKAVRSLALLPKQHADEGLKQMFEYAGQQQAKSTSGDKVALQLAAACLAYDKSGMLQSSAWLQEARDVLQSEVVDSAVKTAAVEVLAATGAEEDLCNLLLSTELAPAIGVTLPTHAAICTMRALRHGKIRLTTVLLRALAEQCWSAIKEWNDTSIEHILSAIRRFRNASCSMVASEKLRFCATLPTMLGLSGVKRYRENAHVFLRATLANVVSHCNATGSPMPDYVTACFLHFLSHLSLFATDGPGYSESSKVATFFCEAMTHNDASRATFIAERLLSVVNEMHLFCDKESPDSNMLQLASGVLRYVIERRCPNVIQNKAQSPQRMREGSRGYPAALLMLRPRAASRIPVVDAPQSGATPICDGETQSPRKTQASPIQSPTQRIIQSDRKQRTSAEASPILSPTQRITQSDRKQRTSAEASPVLSPTQRITQSDRKSPAKLDAGEREPTKKLEDILPPGPLRMKRPASEYSSSYSPALKRPANEKTQRSPKT